MRDETKCLHAGYSPKYAEPRVLPIVQSTTYVSVLHPASETHRQLTEEQLQAAGIHPAMIRLSVGLENLEDIIEDLEIGFKAII